MGSGEEGKGGEERGGRGGRGKNLHRARSNFQTGLAKIFIVLGSTVTYRGIPQGIKKGWISSNLWGGARWAEVSES